MEHKIKKLNEFTDGEIELLKALNQGCNIALYRTGQARLRSKDHNPIRNIPLKLFNEIRPYIIQRDGLFVIDPNQISLLPQSILK